MTNTDYWEETIAIAAEECGLVLTSEQLTCLSEAAMMSHENYSMAYYSPSWAERVSDIENEWKAKLQAIEREIDAYRTNAETAVKLALRQHSDANVSIGEHGEVFRHDGRTEQIQ